MDKNQIRETVRDRYAAVARANDEKIQEENVASCCGHSAEKSDSVQATSCCGTSAEPAEKSHAAGCCGGPAHEEVKESAGACCGSSAKVETEQASSACCGSSAETETSAQDASCCAPADVTTEQMANIMGYNAGDLQGMPEGANMSLGCGNPVALASLKPGETVVDLGSGGGFDCFLAAKEVGETGQVIGVDMTPDMISKARKNVEKMSTSNVEFRMGEIEHLPIADNTADIIMSNCVINLSPEKEAVYSDAFRVLKPGGRLAISDVLATAELPEEVKNDLALVSACIGGAASISDTEEMLKSAGFEDIKIETNKKTEELLQKWDPEKSSNAGDYVISAYIEGRKPLQA
jgi:arsenite methyltransferase